jgi:hypothetical protein
MDYDYQKLQIATNHDTIYTWLAQETERQIDDLY